MKDREQYDHVNDVEMVDKYRRRAHQTTGGICGRIWYRRGIRRAKIGDMFDDMNYFNYYNTQEHDKFCEKMGHFFFERAARCFRKAAKRGNDLAVMNYAVYLFAFKSKNEEALEQFFKASKLGLAVADYQLWLFYKEGLCGVQQDEDKAAFYLEQYHTRCKDDLRQALLAASLEEDGERIIGRAYMYDWFCGFAGPEIYDAPSVKPPKWKYE